MLKDKITAAVIQATPVLFQLEPTLEKVRRLTAEAARRGADLVLFPEAFVSAYPRGISFGAVVGSRTGEGREQWLRYWESCLDLESEAFEHLRACARDHRVHLAIGVNERTRLNGTVYCSLLILDPAGELIAHHRKIKPTAAERIIWGEGDGQSIKVQTTKLGRVGGLICWENYMPLARFSLYQQGIEIYLAPTADARDSWQSTLTHIALEGRCFVLGCNQYVEKKDYAAVWQSELDGQPEVMCRGGSTIISPLGEVLAGPFYGGEEILMAELDWREIIRSKLDFDPVGHYFRGDLFG
jgi:nitrilase